MAVDPRGLAVLRRADPTAPDATHPGALVATWRAATLEGRVHERQETVDQVEPVVEPAEHAERVADRRGRAADEGVGSEQPLEVDLHGAGAGLPPAVEELDTGELYHLEDLLGEDAVGARRRVHAVEGEQAAVGAPTGPGPEEPGVRHRVQCAQRERQLIGGPPGRPRPWT